MENIDSSKLSTASKKHKSFHSCILQGSIVNFEKDIQAIRKKIDQLESEFYHQKDFSCQEDGSQFVETINLLGEDVILVCQRKARDNVRCFVRNLLRQLFEPCILREFSLSGRRGRKKVPKYILDFVLEQCKQKFPESNVKTVRQACDRVFYGERYKLKRLNKSDI